MLVIGGTCRSKGQIRGHGQYHWSHIRGLFLSTSRLVIEIARVRGKQQTLVQSLEKVLPLSSTAQRLFLEQLG
jgi:hypothetical protein